MDEKGIQFISFIRTPTHKHRVVEVKHKIKHLSFNLTTALPGKETYDAYYALCIQQLVPIWTLPLH
jgi:hypothetical protein